jgi:DNA-binding response OmpR family regulator
MASSPTRKTLMRELIFVFQREAGYRSVGNILEQAGYSVRTFASVSDLDEKQQLQASLLVIDARHPEAARIEICKHLRQSPPLSRLPIVVCTSGLEEDRFRALAAGADECIAEPFSPRELVARVQSVLRRAPRMQAPHNAHTDIVIDRGAMKLSVRGAEITTTSLEFRLVDYLALHPGRVFSRDLLLDAVWGEMQFVTPRSVDACIRRVRRKIEPDRARPTFLKTVRGVGYRFDAIASWLQD